MVSPTGGANGDDGAPEPHLVSLATTAGKLVVATTVLGSAVAQLTATVVNVALPRLADDLAAGSADQQWVINAYLLTLASLILVGGSLGDRYGRVRIYRIGVAWFGVASLLCAVAPTIELLVAARLLQGVGGALLAPGSLSIIQSTLVRDDRGRGVGLWSGLSGISAALGPLIGGLLVAAGSWRWAFVLNLPLAVVVLVLSTRIPETRDHHAPGDRLDVGGAVLAAAALGGLSYALIEGPEAGLTAAVAVAVVAALVGLIGLVVLEPRRAHPMVPIELFATRAFAAANAITLIVYGGMGVVFFLLSIQLQVTAGWSPVAAGTALLPVTLLMLVLSSRAGELAQRIGPRWPLTVGPLGIAAGMVLMTRIGPDTSFLTDVAPATIVFGLGLSLTVAPVTATALGSVPDDRAGAASGTNNAVARTGQLLAVAAIPPLVGLTGDSLSDPTQLDAGFGPAMVVAAAMVAAGGLLAAVLLRTDDLEATADDDEGAEARWQCPVDGPVDCRPALVGVGDAGDP